MTTATGETQTDEWLHCRLCADREVPAEALMVDRNGWSWPVCGFCARIVQRGDWRACQAASLTYQMHDATRWDWAAHGWKARRDAHRWARAVRTLMEPHETRRSIHG